MKTPAPVYQESNAHRGKCFICKIVIRPVWFHYDQADIINKGIFLIRVLCAQCKTRNEKQYGLDLGLKEGAPTS